MIFRFRILLLSTLIFIGYGLSNYIYAQISKPGVRQIDYETIQNSLDQKKGSGYKVIGIVNFDSAQTAAPGIFEKPVRDPYGTLKNCYLFIASGDFGSNSNNKGEIIGIYKDQRILWLSGPLATPINFSGGKFTGSLDLNKDNKVDLIITLFSGLRSQKEVLWIYSWDGSTGSPIIDTDTKGRSNLTMQRGSSELVDIEPDGILEIKGKDREGNPIVYSWNGQKYGDWGALLPQKLPRNHFNAQVQANIKTEHDHLVYFFTIHNQAGSLQSIEQFAVKNLSIAPQNVKEPENWDFNPNVKYRLISWQVSNFLADHSDALIEQGKTISSFSFTTNGLPRPAIFYLKGNNGKLSFNTKDLITNSVKGTTLGPYDPPDPFDAAAFADSLRSFVSQACNLGWVTNNGICRSLQSKLDNVQKQLKAGKAKTAANGTRSFINEVEAQKGKHLTSEGYGLLYFNGRYLLEHLSN